MSIDKWDEFLRGKPLTAAQSRSVTKVREIMLVNCIPAPASDFDAGTLDLHWTIGSRYLWGSVLPTGDVEWFKRDDMANTSDGTEDPVAVDCFERLLPWLAGRDALLRELEHAKKASESLPEWKRHALLQAEKIERGLGYIR